MQWIVSQIGARQHYGVPRGFQYKGHLRKLYTDVWCPWGSTLVPKTTPRLRSLAGRYHPDLPPRKVTAFSIGSVLRAQAHPALRTTTERYEFYRSFGHWFGRRVAKSLHRQRLDPTVDLFFGFNTGCLEPLEYLQQKGITTVVDQIDPARVHEQVVQREMQRWPGWQDAADAVPEQYYERLEKEWQLADLVLVNSLWSKKALIAQGVPEQKLVVTPVAFESATAVEARQITRAPLTVLSLGTVTLSKGIQYLLEAARTLAESTIKFIVAGPISISDTAIRAAPPNVTFVGRVTRDQSRDWYRKADIFILPTLSDGFAITQIEAMAEGLPVVTTPNCGEVVTHGLDGVIVPPADSAALAAALATLNEDRKLLADMSYYALRKSKTFHLPRQADEIERAVLPLLASR